MEQFLKKTQNWYTDIHTDRQTDRQQWFYKALRRPYALIPVLTPNLVLTYLFYNCYLFKLKKLFGDKLNWQCITHSMCVCVCVCVCVCACVCVCICLRGRTKLNWKLQKIWRQHWASKLNSRLNSCHQVQGFS